MQKTSCDQSMLEELEDCKKDSELRITELLRQLEIKEGIVRKVEEKEKSSWNSKMIDFTQWFSKVNIG